MAERAGRFVAQLAPDGTLMKDGFVTPDGFIVNNLSPEAVTRAPLQTMPHIGNRLDAAGISWAWYATAHRAVDRRAPFLLFEDVTAGTPGAKRTSRATPNSLPISRTALAAGRVREARRERASAKR